MRSDVYMGLLFLFLCREAEGHEFALKPSVVEAALLIRTAAETALKAGMRRDRREREARVTAQQ